VRAIVLMCAAAVAIGFIAPANSGRAASLLLFVVAVTILSEYLIDSGLDLGADPSTAFDSPDPPEPATIVTPDISEVIEALETHPRRIPADVLRQIEEIATSRLADHHGLRLDEPDDRAAIRTVISPLLADIVATPTNADPAEPPLRALDGLLAELESL